MRFEIKVALRYLTSHRLQTGLILAGVAVGIVAYTFMAALINGLEVKLTQDVIGNLAHVTLEPPDRLPRYLGSPPDQGASEGSARPLVAIQRGSEPRQGISGWRRHLETVESTPGVLVASPVVAGGGFARRGETVRSVILVGLLRDRISAIVDLEDNRVAGDLDLGPEEALVGTGLARELGVDVGQRIVLTSERGRRRSLTVSGLFEVGNVMLDEGRVFLPLDTAQSLMDLEGAVSRIEIKVDDIYGAPEMARRLAGATGLAGDDWIAQNQRLQEALVAQGSSGQMIKAMALLTIVIGVASVLLLSAVRRRPEIGILRSFGVSKASISAIFLLQGIFIGLVGSGVGSGAGWLLCRLLEALTLGPDGSPVLPVDPSRGEYGTAMLLSTLAGALAAILPARAAARVDPVEVIQQ